MNTNYKRLNTVSVLNFSHLSDAVKDALRVNDYVVITGVPGSGKSHLVHEMKKNEKLYFSIDDNSSVVNEKWTVDVTKWRPENKIIYGTCYNMMELMDHIGDTTSVHERMTSIAIIWIYATPELLRAATAGKAKDVPASSPPEWKASWLLEAKMSDKQLQGMQDSKYDMLLIKLDSQQHEFLLNAKSFKNAYIPTGELKGWAK